MNKNQKQKRKKFGMLWPIKMTKNNINYYCVINAPPSPVHWELAASPGTETANCDVYELKGAIETAGTEPFCTAGDRAFSPLFRGMP